MKIGIWKFRALVSLLLIVFVLNSFAVFAVGGNSVSDSESGAESSKAEVDTALKPSRDRDAQDAEDKAYAKSVADAFKKSYEAGIRAEEEDAAITQGTILPGTALTVEACKIVMAQVSIQTDLAKKRFDREILDDKSNVAFPYPANTILACAIKTGDIRLWMVPYYIRYMLEFVVGIAGLIAVGGIIVGGYLYLFAGVSEDKDRGKKAILYGVVGLIMTLIAWAFVNIVITIVT